MGRKTDFVSVIIPVLNAEAFLHETLSSLLGQTFTNWEALVIIDPATTDRSEFIASSFASQDPRLKILNARNPGVAAARNRALAQASGRWVSFLDADDQWLPTKLEQQVDFMTTTQAQMSATEYRRFRGGQTGRRQELPSKITYAKLLGQNILLCSSVMLDWQALSEFRFREMGCEDFDLWLRICRSGVECQVLHKDLVRYRVAAGSRGSKKWKTAQESFALLQQELGFLNAVRRFPSFLVRGAIKHSRF